MKIKKALAIRKTKDTTSKKLKRLMNGASDNQDLICNMKALTKLITETEDYFRITLIEHYNPLFEANIKQIKK